MYLLLLFFKGTLYILAEHSSKQRSLLVMHNWSVVKELWIAVARILPSEKPSIIQLVTAISMLLMRTIETTSVHLTFTDKCIASAQLLTKASLEEKEFEQAVRIEMECSQKNEQLYYELLDSLVEILTNGSLHWRMYNLAFHMLCLQLRADLPAPSKMISIFVQNLIHDAIAVRKVAIKGVAAILKQQKKEHKKIVVNPSDIARQFSPPHFEESPRKYATILLQYVVRAEVSITLLLLLFFSIIVVQETSGTTAGCSIKEKGFLRQLKNGINLGMYFDLLKFYYLVASNI